MADYTPVLDLSKYIDHQWFEGRPHIRGRRLPVWVIAHAAQGDATNVKQLAYDYTISEAEVLAALLYYEENKDEIETQEAAINELYRHFYE